MVLPKMPPYVAQTQPSEEEGGANGSSSSRFDLRGLPVGSARTSVMRANVPGLADRVPVFGPSLPGSFAFFDQLTFSWRTCLRSLFEGFPEFSETWPRSGLMLNWIASRLLPLVPRIDAGESSLSPMPMPTAHCAKNQKTPYKQGGCGLVALLLATPCAADSKGHNCYSRGKRNQSLSGMVKTMYPSPRADGRDNAGGSNSRRIAKARGTYFGRTINPGFVEWMMGFPRCWTELPTGQTA